MVIDRAQTSNASVQAKLMQHSDVGRMLALRQAHKASPPTLLWQQAHHCIKRVSRGQERQQVGAPKLGRRERTPLAGMTSEGKCAVDKFVWNEVRYSFQKRICAGDGESRLHHK